MSNELAPQNSTAILDTQMRYAEVLAQSELVPQAYRGKPANCLLAIGLGQSMGLSPSEALMRIDVIQGKATASAELVASNVRRAGHKLRLEVNQNPPAARCVIVRADDPDYEHVVIRDEAWAKQMGLSSKDNYKKQPATMLGWRAITACARQACPEALYGVTYTADEMLDASPSRPSRHTATRQAPAISAADFGMPDATGEEPAVDTATGEVIEEQA